LNKIRKMKQYFIILCAFVFSFNTISAQDIFKNYKPIVSSGEIPQEFVVKSSEKVEEEIDDFTSGEKGKTRKYKKDFLVSTTFSTKKVLMSGKVLYNDPVTVYINKVANEIFKSNPDLDKNDFRIYAYKSPIVNAFAFNDGLVLINLGLIAQLENEAQLALILSHEFTHVVNKDAIELFLSSKDIENGLGIYKNISYDDKMLYKSRYSQEKESTADIQGLGYYKNTKYSLKPINGVFDVLKYSYLPFDDIVFDTTYFEKEKYIFPSEYTLDEVNPISPDGLEDEDEDEEILKSHPGAEERREAALEEITLAELKDNTKKIYLVSDEKEFKKIRNICRFEMPRMYLLYGYYEMAFYNVYLLEKLGFKDNLYLDKLKAKAIGQMARSINDGERPTRSRIRDIEDEMQGESQQLYFFLNSLGRKKKEFNVFSVEYTYQILKKYPKDDELQKMFSSLLYEMFDETNLKFSTFKKKYPGMKAEKPTLKDSVGLVLDEEVALAKKEAENLEKERLMNEIRGDDSKYKKIKKKVEKQEEEAVSEKPKSKKAKEEYYKFAFVDYMSDKKFTKEAKKVEKEYKAENERELTKEERKIKSREYRLDKARGLALGIDKIVVVDPLYLVVQNDGAKLYKSEKAQEEYNKIIEMLSKKSKLEVSLVDVNKLENDKTEQFNHATILNEWIGEQFLFDEPLEFTSIEKEKIDELKNTYGTKYFLWTGVISLLNKKHTLMYNILYNIESGEIMLRSFKDVRYNTNKNIIKSELYHVFDQIKTNRKIK